MDDNDHQDHYDNDPCDDDDDVMINVDDHNQNYRLVSLHLK